MHIVETEGETLDYQRFYDFPEGTDITKAAGHRTWELLHGLADNYPCPPCKKPFQILMSGAHDVVNLHLGKPVHNPKAFDEFIELVAHAAKMRRREIPFARRR